ncbi:gamma-glutamyltranspeptidase [Salmonella enterica subsp. enterica]|nr:gamma-glutamyltranspeptidase [Salmonella enterica subsp. enterica]
MKPTFMRWVAIAALLAGGTFSAVGQSSRRAASLLWC